MVAIYCSLKLQKFLGNVEARRKNRPESILGNWNGHTFHVSGKRCLIFLNNKTCYCFLMADVRKQRLGNIELCFKERLIQQLNRNFHLPETIEVSIRSELTEIQICRTNNDRNVNGTMNQWISSLPYYTPRFGPVEDWDELFMSDLLNETPVTAKVFANKAKTGYLFPIVAMKELINNLKRKQES